MKFDPLPWPGQPMIGRPARLPSSIALLGNFPPRRCGLATYTHDSYLALRDRAIAPCVDVYAMDDGQVEGYGAEISMLVAEQDIAAYIAAADAINSSGAQILWIQHEFGIFGGEAGSHLLALVNHVRIPIALTLHTVLEDPNGAQRSVLQALLDRAGTVIVMAEKGREILERTYRVDSARISVIPHGIPDRVRIAPADARRKLGLDPSRPTLLTFGLLSPDKGIADMIEAMPIVCTAQPDAQYIVLGATHPHLKRQNGERYREELTARVAELGLQDAVTFVDRFVDLDELTDWLAAADVYVTPYRNPAQITSGTLSYAVGLGKAVVSTPYIHATEILADDHGRLVPMHAPTALGMAVAHLLTDDADRLALGERAWQRGRSMTWPQNAEAVLTAMAPTLRRTAAAAHPEPQVALNIVPIERMTDGTGMLQHSIMGIADRRHGYCIDDNARGLLLMALADDLPLADRTRYATTYASFVQHAWNDDTGRYRNFMGYNREWLEDVGSEDSNGRTLWSIGVAAAQAPSAALRDWAACWYDRTSESLTTLQPLRSRAFEMLGGSAMARVRPNDARIEACLRENAAVLTDALARSRTPDWIWFEDFLSYDNTRLSEALIRAGLVLNDAPMVAAGIETLEWLSTKTTGHNGIFQPVGTASFGHRFAAPALFDQQPLEAWAMIDACAAAWDATLDPRWQRRAEAAHGWFLGRNTLSLPLVDAESGECGDGLTPFEANLNNGAESVIAWQIGHRAFMRLSQMAGTVEKVVEPIAEAA
jgi:glycosyltransferase involved in cell wall biosynthesis